MKAAEHVALVLLLLLNLVEPLFQHRGSRAFGLDLTAELLDRGRVGR